MVLCTEQPEHRWDECRYGPWGAPGRAFRDAPLVAVNRPWAAALMTLSIGAVTGAAIIVPPGSAWVKLLYALGGIVLGMAVGTGIVWVAGLTPLARRGHWHMTCAPFMPSSDPGTFMITLESRHWHSTMNLRCVVRGPDNTTSSFLWAGIEGRPFCLFGPGDTAKAACPQNFPELDTRGGAAPRGRYRIAWEMDVEERGEPVTVASKRFKW